MQHSWNLTPKQAIALQKELRSKVIAEGKIKEPHIIAGVDISYSEKHLGFCAITLYKFPELKLLNVYKDHAEIKFPYISGLLSFREGPLFLKAFRQLEITPDVIIFDGQGIAHPRGLGLASHMGLFIRIPSIGCAKSRLYGRYEEPGIQKLDYSYLYNNENESIGIVLRTRTGVKPVFISPGHMIGIEQSRDIITHCITGYRIPEPTRRAHILVTEYKKLHSRNKI